MIELAHVGLRYSFGPEILSDIHIQLDAGSFHFLVGPSGSGKTSFMKLLSLGHLPTRGVLKMFGVNVVSASRAQRALIRQRIGVVFQDFRLLPGLTAYENVALPLRIMGRPEAEISKSVSDILGWVGLGDQMRLFPETLSGGQQQRVAIARAVIGKPRLLLADEPTGNLDDAIGLRILGLFDQLNRMGTTIVIATHNQSLIDQFRHPRLALKSGQLTLETPPALPLSETLRSVY